MPTRFATAVWEGDLPKGKGLVTSDSRAVNHPYNFSNRFENAPGTNPEELLGAAHAACFSMALSNILAEDGHVAESVRTTAKVHLRNVDGAPTVSKIELSTEGRVPGLDQAQFAQYAEQAKTGCPISRAVAAVGDITLEATLAG